MTHPSLLYLASFVMQMIGGLLPLMWLHYRVPSWTLIPAAMSAAAFFMLLRLHEKPRERFYTIYAGIYLLAVIFYSLSPDSSAHPRLLPPVPI